MRPASIMSPCERGSNLRFDRHTAATSRAGGRVSIHLSHRVVQNVERPRGALNPAMRDATDTRHHVCERRHATQAARSGRLEGSHMRMERVAHDERDRGRRQRRPAATPSSQDARRHAPWATIAVCLLFSARGPIGVAMLRNRLPRFSPRWPECAADPSPAVSSHSCGDRDGVA